MYAVRPANPRNANVTRTSNIGVLQLEDLKCKDSDRQYSLNLIMGVLGRGWVTVNALLMRRTFKCESSFASRQIPRDRLLVPTGRSLLLCRRYSAGKLWKSEN